MPHSFIFSIYSAWSLCVLYDHAGPPLGFMLVLYVGSGWYCWTLTPRKQTLRPMLGNAMSLAHLYYIIYITLLLCNSMFPVIYVVFFLFLYSFLNCSFDLHVPWGSNPVKHVGIVCEFQLSSFTCLLWPPSKCTTVHFWTNIFMSFNFILIHFYFFY